jgi:ankyrin repeat protein
MSTLAIENIDGELLSAAETGNTERAGEMLRKGAVIDCRNNYGVSPLIWAANNNHMETLQLLVKNNADKEAKSNDGRYLDPMASYFSLAIYYFAIGQR